MTVLIALGDGLREALSMFWATLWALVLGFALSGMVQAFVSRGRMRQVLGDHRPRTVATAGFLGFVSSSCSYAAAALAKSLFARGADFTASMVFMFASTNLVVELGIVMWVLLGWQFAAAELVGGVLMIAMLGVVLPRVLPPSWLDRARAGLEDTGAASVDDEPDEEDRRPGRRRIMSRAGWSAAAGYTISDLTMLRKELVIGFGVAGFATVLVPTWVWQSLFLTGGGFWASVENVLIGPLLAVLAFVCSIGNVPLAAALWAGGISFGGVIAFVFADLITLPLLVIYRRYYGTRVTLRLLAVFWPIMSLAGLAVEGLFSLVGWVPTARAPMVAMGGIGWDYTTVLNIVALVGLAGLYALYRTRGRRDEGRHAKDPVCGMQVEKALAPATARRAGQTYYFCSDHCRHRFADGQVGGTVKNS
ncbi:MAG TPA: permease [Pseudonocardia sp.]